MGLAKNSDHNRARQNAVLEEARAAGFDLAGLAPLAPPPDAARFERWLAAGHHAGMRYLEQQRADRLDPRRLVSSPFSPLAPVAPTPDSTGPPQPRNGSLLMVGLGHSRPAFALTGGGRLARYAAGRDYHKPGPQTPRQTRPPPARRRAGLDRPLPSRRRPDLRALPRRPGRPRLPVQSRQPAAP